MNTKENVREQLQEKTIQEIFEIMNMFFRTDSFSWQADVLYDVVRDCEEACAIFYSVVIDKIVAEVSVKDIVDGGWIETPTYTVYVEWDTDGEEVDDLSSEVEIPYDVDEDDIADWLSDEYGYCVESFSVE